jgi:hypothetical protein
VRSWKTAFVSEKTRSNELHQQGWMLRARDALGEPGEPRPLVEGEELRAEPGSRQGTREGAEGEVLFDFRADQRNPRMEHGLSAPGCGSSIDPTLPPVHRSILGTEKPVESRP